jgi:hypothetical protein
MPARKKKAVVKRQSTDVASIQEQIAQQAMQMQGAVGTAIGNRIRITQGKKFISPDGAESNGPINVVILDFNSQNMFYPELFNKDNPQPPTCFALNEPASIGGRLDAMVPSDSAPDKQHEECASCPMNQFGTDVRGSGKACKNQRVLAVISPDDEDPEEAPISLITVSPSALKRFDGHVRSLASKGATPVTVITELSFDEDVDYPSLQFRAIQPNPHLAAHWSRLPEAQDLLRVEPDLTQFHAREEAAPKRATRKKAPLRRRSA